eukprot:1194258-Prorocentrum_minimum.AAC.7
MSSSGCFGERPAKASGFGVGFGVGAGSVARSRPSAARTGLSPGSEFCRDGTVLSLSFCWSDPTPCYSNLDTTNLHSDGAQACCDSSERECGTECCSSTPDFHTLACSHTRIA